MAARFADANGEEWVIPTFTIGLYEDVKDASGIDLYLATEDKDKFAEQVFSPRNVGALLWVLCEKQAEERQLDARAFARRFDGPTVERAGEAIMECLADFSPRSKVGQWAKANLRANLNNMDDAIIAHLSKPSTGSPGSVVKIHAPSA